MTNTDIAVREDALPATLAASTVLEVIAKAAADPSTDVAKMSALIDMHERLMGMQAKNAYNEAMARLRPDLPRIKKSGEVRYPIRKGDENGPTKHAFNFAPIRSILLLLSLISLVGMPYTVLMPVLARDILHGGPHTLGFLVAMSGIGALTGAIYLAGRKSVLGLGRLIALTAGIFGLSIIAFPKMFFDNFSFLIY